MRIGYGLPRHLWAALQTLEVGEITRKEAIESTEGSERLRRALEVLVRLAATIRDWRVRVGS